MLPVSATWQQAIKEQFRYQGYLRVILQVTPPGLQDALQIKTPDSESFSNPEVMNDSSSDVVPYASLENNRWLLNGKFDILDDGVVTDDWWSTPLATGEIKTLLFTFDKIYNIPGIYFEWDVVNQTYPALIRVTAYGTENTEIGSAEVSNISSATGFVDLPFDNVLKVKLEILDWNVTNWRARIAEILFGLYAKYDSINNGRVSSAESYDYSSPISEDLPKHTISVKLRNEDKEFDPSLTTGVAKYLARRQLIQYQWGFATSYNKVEWAPLMDYYVDSFKIPEDSKEVELSATSRLDFLEEEYRFSEYNSAKRTLYDIAQEILSRSSIIKEADTETPWELSNTLKQFSTSAPIPVKSVKSLLQLIAGAATCWLRTNAQNGYVAITDFLTDSVGQVKTSVGLTQELGDPAFDIQEQLLSLSIGVYAYTVSSEKTTLSENEYSINGETTLTINYNVNTARSPECQVSGATLVSFTGYSSSCIVVIKPSSGTTANATVTITGYEVKSSVTYIETYRDTSITHGLAVQIDNEFITDTASLSKLSNWIVQWYQKRQKIEIPYIGYPEIVAGDSAKLTTIYGTHDVDILGNKISFNGGFNGTLEVR